MNETTPKPRITREDLQRAACRADFIRVFNRELEKAGVRVAGYDDLKNRTVAEIAAAFAHHGIRLRYCDTDHVESVVITDAVLDAANALR